MTDTGDSGLRDGKLANQFSEGKLYAAQNRCLNYSLVAKPAPSGIFLQNACTLPLILKKGLLTPSQIWTVDTLDSSTECSTHCYLNHGLVRARREKNPIPKKFAKKIKLFRSQKCRFQLHFRQSNHYDCQSQAITFAWNFPIATTSKF